MKPSVNQNPSLTLVPRDLYHFVAASLPAFFLMWQSAGYPTNKAALWALAPGAATVLFRKVFPNMGNLKPIQVPSLDPTLPPNGGVAS